jgi:hypothetical protein
MSIWPSHTAEYGSICVRVSGVLTRTTSAIPSSLFWPRTRSTSAIPSVLCLHQWWRPKEITISNAIALTILWNENCRGVDKFKAFYFVIKKKQIYCMNWIPARLIPLQLGLFDFDFGYAIAANASETFREHDFDDCDCVRGPNPLKVARNTKLIIFVYIIPVL